MYIINYCKTEYDLVVWIYCCSPVKKKQKSLSQHHEKFNVLNPLRPVKCSTKKSRLFFAGHLTLFITNQNENKLTLRYIHMSQLWIIFIHSIYLQFTYRKYGYNLTMNVNVDWDASVIFMTAFKSKGSLTVKGFLSNDLIKKIKK